MTKAAPYHDRTCRYFAKPGGENTRAVLKAANARAVEADIGKIVVATCTGETALAALEIMDPKIQIVAVTHVQGFGGPNMQELSDKVRCELQEKGVDVLTCQHAFGGVGRGIRKKLNTYQVEEIMAYTLRTFGQGTKVAIEVSLMAADAGLIRTDEDVIATGGTVSGIDTALLLRPVNSSDVLDLKVKEIICKPAAF
ncbi:MAG: pyruvate kinase alpha/beta domain-containing protein [Smithellaceae bacterium]|nr:pyruvate kinase alpha/beta domain-containing protein [Smithellaceae bacterium]